jgi:Zierdtviridae exonuclease
MTLSTIQSKTRSREERIAKDLDLPKVRTSQRGLFKKCRWVYEREFIDRLKPQVPAPALRFGTLVHAALAKWYVPGVRRGTHPADTFLKLYEAELEDAYKFGFRDEEGVWQEAGELGVDMLENYVKHWGRDEGWRVIATEQPFQTLVLHPRTGRPWFWYVGIIDGLWQNREDTRLYIPDHKTTTSITTEMLTLDEQASSYWTYGVDWLRKQRILKPKHNLGGMLHNFLRKAMHDTRKRDAAGHYLNLDGSISKKQPPPYFLRAPILRDPADKEVLRERVEQEVTDIEAAHSGELPMYKTPSLFNCRTCWAKNACELHEAGADWQDYLKMTTVEWEPHAEHEIREAR